MAKWLCLFLLIFSLGACQDADSARPAEASLVGTAPLSYQLLTEHAWRQATRSPGKFSLCRFTWDASSPNQLRVTMSTGNGQNLEGLFRFTDKKDTETQRSGLFIMEGGLIEEEVTLRFMPQDNSLVIIDSMGQEQELRRTEHLSRSRS